MGVAPPPVPVAPPKLRQRYTRGGLIRLLGFLLVSVFVGFLFIAGYLALYLSTTIRHLPATTPASVSLSYQAVSFPAQIDGIPLRGWWIPAGGSDRTVVLLHGKDSHRAGGPALDVARFLHQAGYNALLFDFRGCGESGGDRFSLGYYEVRDVSGAVAYLQSEHPEAAGRIAVIGFSMGAAVGVLAAARDPAIGAVIEDSGYAELTELLEREIPRQSRLPGIITWPTVWMGRLLLGYDISTVRPVDAMPALADRAILIIHGTEDTVVTVDHAHRLAQAAQASRAGSAPPADVWIVPEVTHVGAFSKHPAGYQRRVLDFLDRALATPVRPAAARTGQPAA